MTAGRDGTGAGGRSGISPEERRAQLDELLRRCIQCGLCLPHCATYLATRSEVQSPRGRLLLLGEVLAAGDRAAPRETLQAFDLCLGCRACETACPSGVAFELLEHAHDLALARTPFATPLLAGRLDERRSLRRLRRDARLARGLLRALLGVRWRRRLERAPAPLRRLARQLGTLPRAPERDEDLVRLLAARENRTLRPGGEGDAPAAGSGGEGRAGSVPDARPPRIAFFEGCASSALLPGTARRLRRLLEAGGCRVDRPPGQECCGALARHAGEPCRADRLRARNAAALLPALDGIDALVVEAAGCGLELRRYPPELAGKVRDATELLAGLTLPAPRPVPLRVALHDACHLRHGQGLVRPQRRLLAAIPGLELIEPEEAEVCCGSGGPYTLRHPELSALMGRRKAERLASTGADLVVTTNPGCLGQLADGLALVAPGLPILPLSDLLWYAHLAGR